MNTIGAGDFYRKDNEISECYHSIVVLGKGKTGTKQKFWLDQNVTIVTKDGELVKGKISRINMNKVYILIPEKPSKAIVFSKIQKIR